MSDDGIKRLRGMVGRVPSAAELAEQRKARVAASIKRNRERGVAVERKDGQAVVVNVPPTKKR